MEKQKRTTSPVIFQVDTKLKKRAMKRAREEGMPLASVLKLATQAYADRELDIRIVCEEFNAKTRREIATGLRDIKQGKNLSPIFRTAKEAIEYLKS